MVERFNGPIEDVLQRQHVRSGDKLGLTLHRYVWLYNRPLAQSALGRKTPLQAMKQWHKRKPNFLINSHTTSRDVTTADKDYPPVATGSAASATRRPSDNNTL